MMSLPIDDRSLADGMYRSGDRQSYQPPPYQPPPHHPSLKYHLQHPQFSKFHHIEADVIVNRINHHHIIYHQGIIYNILNFLNFSMKRNHQSI